MMRLTERLSKLIKLSGDWPPLVTDFSKGKWGAIIWDVDKPCLPLGSTDVSISYLQSVINQYSGLGGAPLRVDGQYGPKTYTAIAALAWRYGLQSGGQITRELWGLVDWLAFGSYWKQTGKNKYNGLPVNDHGLTREAAFAECYVRANFPELKFPRNWMVDRLMRGSLTKRSEHAESTALDFTKITPEQGTPVAEWIQANADLWNVLYVIYNHRVAEPAGGRSKAKTALRWLWRMASPKSLQHTDHIHVTVTTGLWPVVNP